jgi:hypothetical protein
MFAENMNQIVEKEKPMKEIWEDKGLVVIIMELSSINFLRNFDTNTSTFLTKCDYSQVHPLE